MRSRLRAEKDDIDINAKLTILSMIRHNDEAIVATRDG